jgi:hypothetical protein
MKDARSKTEPAVVNCRSPFSLFFDLIRRECENSGNAPFHRICTLMRKMGVQCFVREDLELNDELREEQSSAEARTGGKVQLQARRFTFFRNVQETENWQDLSASECLGYAVLVTLTLPDTTKRCYVLESVVQVPSIWVPSHNSALTPQDVTNYYVHCCRQFETVIGTRGRCLNLQLTGSFFCQQNDLTHVCAHAALRMGINSSPAYAGAKLTNKDINDNLGIDHSNAQGKRVGKYGTETGFGLETTHIDTIVRTIGWRSHIAEFDSKTEIAYADFIYPIIESGCPTILGVHSPKTGHVLSVLGHTLNTDRWSPEARQSYGLFPDAPHISTTAWTDHLIVSDDNYGMYSTFPTETIVPKNNPNLYAVLAIGLMPTDVTISGYGAEQSAAGWATKLIHLTKPVEGNRWFRMLQNEPNQKLVCRTLLSEKKDYISFLGSVIDSQGNKVSPAEIAALQNSLPDRFWVTEISVPNLYTGNKRKLGDILTPAKGTEQEFLTGAMSVGFWLPGLFWCQGQPEPTGWSLMGHVPILRGASQNRKILEW